MQSRKKGSRKQETIAEGKPNGQPKQGTTAARSKCPFDRTAQIGRKAQINCRRASAKVEQLVAHRLCVRRRSTRTGGWRKFLFSFWARRKWIEKVCPAAPINPSHFRPDWRTDFPPISANCGGHFHSPECAARKRKSTLVSLRDEISKQRKKPSAQERTQHRVQKERRFMVFFLLPAKMPELDQIGRVQI